MKTHLAWHTAFKDLPWYTKICLRFVPLKQDLRTKDGLVFVCGYKEWLGVTYVLTHRLRQPYEA